ncbi:rhodanese-related sulfurtransferase [Roseofilum casamattae]|uniref:tRNA uridine(34) hydroxylase n=1 Tax=Roseofilum casamattae BLCC-M143 TaxID=3022442 RepID=A0ABT7C2W8_9CYAN|nr:rhodanese-related sulfurtransferase [Roseofilum casamattae]MDJ1185392.1 rhodanese-related sulfurtransferase [Roseofilum casamattae BLCC-M143]
MLVVATFYQFFPFPDYAEWRSPLLTLCTDNQLKGTILLASEGINSTIAGSRDGVNTLLAYLRSDSRIDRLEYKESTADDYPFDRLKVRLKQEIVTLGQPDIDPNARVGSYVRPEDWNELISDPEVTVIDTRNDYEVEIGSFRGAKNPNTHSFRDFPDYAKHRLKPQEHRKIAMFCTGGIRCEKATAFLLQQGFKEVYHLQGGILKYLEEVPAQESLWEGECFVFDGRISVKPGLEPGSYDLCAGCGHPISEEDKASSHYEAGICCPHCYDRLTPEKRSRQQAKYKQRQLKKTRDSK